MAVTKRTRFEVLRRDGFRCYYCGVRGNETTGDGLTIDHVVPKSLGGTDEPTNLVAACGDCNSGKSSVPADAEMVASVDRAASDYNAARMLAMQALEADLNDQVNYVSAVLELWDEVMPSYAHPTGDIYSLAEDWHRRGVPLLLVRKALRIAWAGPAGRAQKARYAGGVVNNLLAEAEDRTRALMAGDDVVFNAGYEAGWKDGHIHAETQQGGEPDAP